MPALWGSAFIPSIPRKRCLRPRAGAGYHAQCDSRRALAGGLYLYDGCAFRPAAAGKHGAVPCRTPYFNQRIDHVITIETKGIPIALMCARVLGVPLIIARRENRMKRRLSCFGQLYHGLGTPRGNDEPAAQSH